MTNLDRGIKMNPKVLEILDHALTVAEKSDKPQQDTICALVELVHSIVEQKLSTLRKRISRDGMTIEEAITTPTMKKTLEMDEVLSVEELQLSLSKSAYLLNVNPSTLYHFINKHSITWRGKGQCFKHGQVNPNSNQQRSKAAGISHNTVLGRMVRKGISFDEALSMGGVK